MTPEALRGSGKPRFSPDRYSRRGGDTALVTLWKKPHTHEKRDLLGVRFRFGLFLQGNSGGGDQSNGGQSGGNANDIVSAGVGVLGASSGSGNAQLLVGEDIGAQGAGLENEAALIVRPLGVDVDQLAILNAVHIGALFLVEVDSSGGVEGGVAGEVQEGDVGISVGISLQNVGVSVDIAVQVQLVAVVDADGKSPEDILRELLRLTDTL